MGRTIIIVIALIAILIIGYYFGSYYYVLSKFRGDSISDKLKFDKGVWKNGTRRQRGQMVDYLIDSIGVIDKTKDEIISLLGIPDDSIRISNEKYMSRLYYQLDKGGAYALDMVLYFDSTNQVKEFLFDD
jgi:hypothetical protein